MLPSSSAECRSRHAHCPPFWVLILGLAALALTPPARAFSDSIFFVERVGSSPLPYYNAAYLPLGWLFHRLGEPVLGWDTFEALRWFSMVCVAGAAALMTRVARAAGWGWGMQLFIGLLFLVTPGVWFFGIAVEVHALQILGATIATGLALAAASRPARRAFLLVGLAVAAALLTHLSSVLLLPILAWLARGREKGLGLPLERLRSIGPRAWLTGLVAGAVTFWLMHMATLAPGKGTWLAPFAWLARYAELFIERLTAQPWFGPLSMLQFLWDEFVIPAGVLLPLALGNLGTRTGRRDGLMFLLFLIPFAFIYPQAGIREEGAYYLPLFPWMALLAARFVADLSRAWNLPFRVLGLGLLLMSQGFLAWHHLERLHTGVDAREWVEEVNSLCPPGSMIVTVSLPRWHAMAYSPHDFSPIDIQRRYQMVPESEWEAVTKETLGQAEAEFRSGHAVYLDADLLHSTDPLGCFEAFREYLGNSPAQLKPVPAELDPPLLYRVTLNDDP